MLRQFGKLLDAKKGSIVSSQCNIPFFSMLGIAFITMKLTGYVDWSWWWVLAPFWIPACFAMVFLLLIFGLIAVASKNIYNTNAVIENTQKDTSVEEESKKTIKKRTSKKKSKNGRTSEKNEQMPERP